MPSVNDLSAPSGKKSYYKQVVFLKVALEMLRLNKQNF